MNKFLQKAIKFINLHGKDIQYVRKRTDNTGIYNFDTGVVQENTILLNIKSYPKQVKATQYSYPNLIDKEIILFKIVPDPTYDFYSWFFDDFEKAFTGDYIVYQNENYYINSVQSHDALGETIYFNVLAVKG